ncbi:transposase [Enhygromyxa salina]|uniref:transposase n=1 Tax=Enhygromyxa salina TaxID=215803 RepID=UPI000D022DBE
MRWATTASCALTCSTRSSSRCAARFGAERRRSSYVARPPIAQERLELTADRRCRYNFRHAWKNGVHAVLLAPLDLIARLCALIPPPRLHMLRYHGVLAAHANRSGWRPACWPESA